MGLHSIFYPAIVPTAHAEKAVVRWNTQNHWERVYETKNPDPVSWTQEIPKTSLDFIHSFGVDKTARIIDIGGGDSKLVDYLLDNGFENITVLDISAKALNSVSVVDNSLWLKWKK